MRSAPSDRATDLDGAVAMARALVSQLPQVDKRVVVLSDLADGRPEAPALGGGREGIPVWVPLPELRADAPRLRAPRGEPRRRARARHGRLRARRGGCGARGDDPRGRQDHRTRAPRRAGTGGEITLTLPADAPADLVARLAGEDAIAEDDDAVVVPEAAAPAVAVIADSADEAAATGGAPIVEQALAALRLDVALRPIPAVPDRSEDLAGFVGLIADDPPGFTPEQRRALSAFLEQGGELLVALGARASEAPLGATLEPALSHAVTWGATTAKGAAESGAAPALGDAARSLGDLGARGRASAGAGGRGVVRVAPHVGRRRAVRRSARDRAGRRVGRDASVRGEHE